MGCCSHEQAVAAQHSGHLPVQGLEQVKLKVGQRLKRERQGRSRAAGRLLAGRQQGGRWRHWAVLLQAARVGQRQQPQTHRRIAFVYCFEGPGGGRFGRQAARMPTQDGSRGAGWL